MHLTGSMCINDAGHLEIAGSDAVELARRYGTPLYVLDESEFRRRCRVYRRAFGEKALILYAGKSLLTRTICRIVHDEGLGLDVSSGGEIYTALSAGFPAEKIHFHGNNKPPKEIKMALQADIGAIMVDNLYELNVIGNMTRDLGITADVMLRITPGVSTDTHRYIETGNTDSKFGLHVETGAAMTATRKALDLCGVNLRGFHCHIGSQITRMHSFARAVASLFAFIAYCKKHTGYLPRNINLGGGLGINYRDEEQVPDITEYADILASVTEKQSRKAGIPLPRLMVEPGRSISGPAGITLYTVGAIKNIPGVRKYVAVDGGMADNPRPALYGASYDAVLANKAGREAKETVTVAGRCCESGDVLIWNLDLPPVESGDILAVGATGAYTFSMSSNYNMLPRPAMVLVGNGRDELVIRRQTYAEILENETVPEHLLQHQTAE